VKIARILWSVKYIITVETVGPSGLKSCDHRAEAPVLMRPLRIHLPVGLFAQSRTLQFELETLNFNLET